MFCFFQELVGEPILAFVEAEHILMYFKYKIQSILMFNHPQHSSSKNMYQLKHVECVGIY